MVRFSGQVPLQGGCTISLADSSGHALADVTATVNGFDASTGLISVVDDDPVTGDRTITATLVSCDLPELESYRIGSPDTAVVLVRDRDPALGIGGIPSAPWETETGPVEETWTPVQATATLEAPETFSSGWRLEVSISPSLPALPESGNGSWWSSITP